MAAARKFVWKRRNYRQAENCGTNSHEEKDTGLLQWAALAHCMWQKCRMAL
jgi:hypothetical protein